MDTKLKKSKKHSALIIVLTIMFILASGAVGVITSYLPANDYYGAGRGRLVYDMFMDNFESTELYKSELRRIESLINQSTLDTEVGRNQLLAHEEYSITIEYDYGSYQRTDSNNVVGKSTYVLAFNDGYTSYRYYYFPNEPQCEYVKSITVGLSAKRYDLLRHNWLIERANMWIIVISDILLFAAAVALMCVICRLCAKRREEDGEKVPRVFSLFYEVTITAICTMFVPLYFLIMGEDGLMELAEASSFGKVFYMLLTGAAAAVFGALWLYLAVSLAVRLKYKKAADGSLIVRIIKLALKAILWCWKKLVGILRNICEIFTGELYKLTAAKKLLAMDLTMIAVTALWFIFMFSDAWVFGCVIEVIAAALFLCGRFFILRDSAVLERQINDIYNGSYGFKQTLTKNSPYLDSSEKLRTLSEQYQKEIEERVKAERMKIDLVTNVSHDLKTPLTSIISYVDLLSKEELPPAAADYVKILQQKSERLKNIVSDVFELAKTTSGEIEVAHEQLDLSKLSWQTLGEMEDKIAKSGIEVKAKICDPPVTVISDGKRVYRIIQNLMDNALKYSLKGTRIYYTLEKKQGRGVITIKNISAYEMNFTAEEITERFTRGDKSRTTEGSGLGLSIAQGFTLACGGEFAVTIDGDMFKVRVSFPIVKETEPAENTAEADE